MAENQITEVKQQILPSATEDALSRRLAVEIARQIIAPDRQFIMIVKDPNYLSSLINPQPDAEV